MPKIRLSGRAARPKPKPKPVQHSNGAVNGQPKQTSKDRESFDFYQSSRHPTPAPFCQCDNPLVFAYELTDWDIDEASCQRCGKRV